MTLENNRLSLAMMQQQFADALLDVDLAERALPLFAASASPQEARLAFYRGNLGAIWSGALANAYPVLLQLVGAGFFEQMARAYGLAHTSQSGDLNHFGADMPAFLADAPMTADYPYFSDVAALEWMVHRAYYAADAEILALPSLIANAGQGLQEVRLKWHPAARLHESLHASVSVWLSHQDGAPACAPFSLAEHSYALVSRPEWRATVIPLSRSGYQALRALSMDKTLGEALETALDIDPQFDIPAALNAWFSVGAFSGYSCSKT